MNTKELFDLHGCNAIVTGGSRGLGLQIAEALGEMGAKVALTARKKAELDEAVAHLAKLGIEASGWPCDLGKREQIAPLVESILKHYGKIDILVNNAGAVWAEAAEKHPVEAWDKLVALNMTANFVLSQAVATKSMIPNRRGRIVNVASVAGLRPAGSSIAYAVAKAGLIHLTRCLAVAMAPEVTVNCVAPGLMEGTRMAKRLPAEVVESTRRLAVLQRSTGIEDVAAQVVAFCRADSVTGQVLNIDAGVHFH